MQEEHGKAVGQNGIMRKEDVMKNTHETILSLCRKILGDPTVTRRAQLPCLSFLWGLPWTEPLIFIYEGDSWPSVIYPCHLFEVSGGFLPVAANNGATAIQHASLTNFETGGSGLSIGDEDYAIKASRFELVGTVFSFESYRIFSRNTSQLNPSMKPEYNRPVSSAVIRVITNESGTPSDEKAATHRIMQLKRRELWQMFFYSFIPLIGVTREHLEKRWSSCLTTGLSQSDMESGGISSSAHSSQALNEERSLVSPNRHPGISIFHASTRQSSILKANSLKFNDGRKNSAASFLTTEGAERNSDFSLRWDIFRHLFDQEERYRTDVERCWGYWANGWDKVNRFDVVDSIDCIITSLGGSREAAHVAATYLDAFVCMSQTVVRDATYFSGVLLACAMLSCKQVDRFFPSIKAFLRYLRPQHSITATDFHRYEMHVLKTLNFCLQPVTSLEIVEVLLYLCGGPAAQQDAERRYRLRELKRWNDGACGGGGGGSNNVYGNNANNNEKNTSDGYRKWTDDSFTNTYHLRWNDLCKLAHFIADLMIRNTRAQEFRHTIMGLAIVAIAAEKTSWVLPAPLVELLPESCRVSIHAGEKAELDCESYELLVRYAATMRCRCEQDGTETDAVSPLWRALALVHECCEEFGTGEQVANSVLQRRYNINHAAVMSGGF
ncbi:hypothetical protein TcYC6_0074920 [Trypanosoma cruzi]|uniref:Cyclin N-terminal domain-containing protein n=1 Tax=Trypanosoma cruzi TaxID=5693 RepID=A0A7J6YA72_TRYCR|nr:hypothetical protein ECC02_003594 [Trypanosoma cruzi]KAF8298869.1 hypothetical protein TcYC6_0074920 [Trypanosoma cruzi]